MIKIFQKKWVWVGLVLIGVGLVFFSWQREKRLVRQEILQVADQKAVEEGYGIERMTKEVKREGDLWRIRYSPKEDILGGGLEIYVDDTGEIKKVLHGQ